MTTITVEHGGLDYRTSAPFTGQLYRVWRAEFKGRTLALTESVRGATTVVWEVAGARGYILSTGTSPTLTAASRDAQEAATQLPG